MIIAVVNIITITKHDLHLHLLLLLAEPALVPLERRPEQAQVRRGEGEGAGEVKEEEQVR